MVAFVGFEPFWDDLVAADAVALGLLGYLPDDLFFIQV